MNIKEHIEAGHYPTDDDGRALVPMGGLRVAVIYATDHIRGSSRFQIIGRDPEFQIRAWDVEGVNEGFAPDNLRPPLPRKVKITKYAVSGKDRLSCIMYDTREEAEKTAGANMHLRHVIELTGEYEEPWP